jgi:hypothetical protein
MFSICVTLLATQSQKCCLYLAKYQILDCSSSSCCYLEFYWGIDCSVISNYLPDTVVLYNCLCIIQLSTSMKYSYLIQPTLRYYGLIWTILNNFSHILCDFTDMLFPVDWNVYGFYSLIQWQPLVFYAVVFHC